MINTKQSLQGKENPSSICPPLAHDICTINNSYKRYYPILPDFSCSSPFPVGFVFLFRPNFFSHGFAVFTESWRETSFDLNQVCF
jgi:hypothetical protein